MRTTHRHSVIARALALLLGLAPALAPADGAARALEAGTPLLRVFLPADYGADQQNWAIAQGPDGVLYVGNTRGVLVFDGQRWTLVPVANGSAVRSLAIDAAGVVHVGAIGEIGRLEAGPDGMPRYVSLLEHVPADARDFADVWGAIATPEGVVFSTRQRLLRWDGTRMATWTPGSRFGVAHRGADGVVLVEAGRGLVALRGDAVEALPGAEAITEPARLGIAPWPGAEGAGEPSLLVSTPDRGFLRLADGALSPWPSAAAEAITRDGLMVKSLQWLADGRLVAGTLQGGLHVLDAQGHPLAQLDADAGLPDPSVAATFQDREGGLWLALGQGLARLAIADPLTRLDARHGLEGAPIALHRHRGTLVVGTTLGAFALRPGPRPRFERLPGIDAQTWAFLSAGDALLVGSVQGVHALEGGRARQVLEAYSASALLASRAHPGRIYVGLADGVAVLEAEGAGWRDAGRLPGVAGTARTLHEDAAGRLWIGTLAGGVLRVDAPAPGAGDASVHAFGIADGLPGDAYNAVVELDGAPAFATAAGVLRFDEAAGRFVPDPAYAGLFEAPRTAWAVHAAAGGGAWLSTEDPASGLRETGLARPGADGAPAIWDPAALRPFAGQEAYAILAEPDGVAWFATPEGLYRLDGTLPAAPAPGFDTLLRRVLAADGRVLHGGGGATASADLALPHAGDALRFEYAAPRFGGSGARADAVRFRTRLDGADAGWSPWRVEDYRDYTNLFEGEYVFRVQAMDARGIVGREATLAFRVLPPWYRTPWAYAAYALALALLGWGLLRWRLRVLLARTRELEATVAERTRQLAAQADDLREANARLVALDGFKQGLMGMIVHDLKHPLGTILSTLDSPSLLSRVAQLRQSARQMLGMVLDLLDVQKFEDARVVPDARPEPLEALVHGAVEQVRFLFERRDQALGVTLPAGLRVQAEAAMLERVLVNLLTNAIKFTPPGGRIAIEATPEADAPGQVRVKVRDSGEGLPAHLHAAVFERFGQVRARDSGQVRSTGLGLTFCKLAVEAHGGRIGVDSAPGEGATFWFTLPLAAGGMAVDGAEVLHAETGAGALAPPDLTPSERAALAPLAARLRSIPIFRYSELRELLDGAAPDGAPLPDGPRVQAWRARVAQAIETENEALLEVLLAL